jgi:hypothetical protein
MLLKERSFSTQWHEDSTTNDIPDSSIAAHGWDGWLEYKFQASPAPVLKLIGAKGNQLSYGQLNWLEKRGQAGCGLCFLVVGYGERQAFTIRYDHIRKAEGMGWEDFYHQAIMGRFPGTYTGDDAQVALCLAKLFENYQRKP